MSDLYAVIPSAMSGKEIALLLKQAGYTIQDVHQHSTWTLNPTVRDSYINFADTQDLRGSSECPYMRSLDVMSCGRNLAGEIAQSPHSGPGTQVSMGHHGNAETVLRTLLDRTGGWLRPGDGTREWEAVLPTSERTSDDVRADRVHVLEEVALETIVKSASDMGITPDDDQISDLRARITEALLGADFLKAAEMPTPMGPR